jgi:hypothetical protein
MPTSQPEAYTYEEAIASFLDAHLMKYQHKLMPEIKIVVFIYHITLSRRQRNVLPTMRTHLYY